MAATFWHLSAELPAFIGCTHFQKNKEHQHPPPPPPFWLQFEGALKTKSTNILFDAAILETQVGGDEGGVGVGNACPKRMTQFAQTWWVVLEFPHILAILDSQPFPPPPPPMSCEHKSGRGGETYHSGGQRERIAFDEHSPYGGQRGS